MQKSFLFVELFKFFLKRKKIDFSKSKLKIGILFLKPLGFGDLIMLSPIIQLFAKIFQKSDVYLITWVPKIIQFEKVKYISKKQASKQKFDVLISPTLNLHHLFYIFRARYWIGYFGKTKLQSNFSKTSFKYNARLDHFLDRGLGLINALDKNKGIELERQMKEKRVLYPDLILEKPEVFEKLANKHYLVVAPFSQYEERQWPFSYFTEIIKGFLEKKVIEKVVIIGGKSNWEKKQLKSFFKNFTEKEKDYFFNLIGKTNLQETAFLIKNSFLYLGLDSGPAHFAYFLAQKSAVIFISVDPLTRIPLSQSLNKNISYFVPKNCPNFPCYSGLYRPNFKKCQKCSLTIKPKEVLYEILNLF